jgi:hypothetical protein
MPRLYRLPCVALLAALSLTACETTDPGSHVPPPPAPPSRQDGPALADWRAIVTPSDHDRYQRRAQAWTVALDQARRLRGSGDLQGLGELIAPDAQRPSVTPPVGDYRCRTVKLGSRGDDQGLGYVVYGWFACRIEATPNGLKFTKRTGSQRPSGLLFPEDDRHMVLLGSMALADDPPANSYGLNPDRDVIAVLERVGERRWRLVIPWPTAESNLDIIELVPA